MKRFILTIACVLLAVVIHAQNITGTWYGLLDMGNSKLHIVYHINKIADGYAATMDSPDQRASGLPVDEVSFQNNRLTLKAKGLGVKYTGTFVPDSGKINGTFQQGFLSLPLVLFVSMQSISAIKLPPRPQDPKDFPYKLENVFFINAKAGNRLAGTLTMPADGKASKIVVLITGSGPQNRDEEIQQFNHRPFLVWSDWLTRHGIAVLRYDDRGIGQSTGDYSTATTADFADDAEAAVSYIRSRADLKHLDIGLMGHSEGGMIAPMVAARNANVKFIVLLAGPGVPITQLMVKQTEDQDRLAGMPDNFIRLNVATTAKLYNLVVKNNALPAAQLKQKSDSLLYAQLRNYPKEALGNQNIDDLVKHSSAELANPWFRYFIAFNPCTYLSKVKCRVLALDGTLDMQVNADANLAGIKECLQQSGNRQVTTELLPGMNHLFQKAAIGSVAEYAQLETTVDPSVLELVTRWITP